MFYIEFMERMFYNMWVVRKLLSADLSKHPFNLLEWSTQFGRKLIRIKLRWKESNDSECQRQHQSEIRGIFVEDIKSTDACTFNCTAHFRMCQQKVHRISMHLISSRQLEIYCDFISSSCRHVYLCVYANCHSSRTSHMIRIIAVYFLRKRFTLQHYLCGFVWWFWEECTLAACIEETFQMRFE